MGTSVTSTGITFPDATTQTTAASGVSTTFNAIGTYSLGTVSNGTAYAGGTSISGSSIVLYKHYTGYYGSSYPATATWGGNPASVASGLSGTWQLMNKHAGKSSGEGGYGTAIALFIRTS